MEPEPEPRSYSCSSPCSFSSQNGIYIHSSPTIEPLPQFTSSSRPIDSDLLKVIRVRFLKLKPDHFAHCYPWVKPKLLTESKALFHWAPAHSLLAPIPLPQPHLPTSHTHCTVSAPHLCTYSLCPKWPPPLLGLANLSVHSFSKYVVRLTVFQAQCYVLGIGCEQDGQGPTYMKVAVLVRLHKQPVTQTMN